MKSPTPHAASDMKSAEPGTQDSTTSVELVSEPDTGWEIPSIDDSTTSVELVSEPDTGLAKTVASPLSPDQIATKRFRPALRGWDRQQVHSFLLEVAALVEANAAVPPSFIDRATLEQALAEPATGALGS
jgi:DivIVA domain-containing protein